MYDGVLGGFFKGDAPLSCRASPVAPAVWEELGVGVWVWVREQETTCLYSTALGNWNTYGDGQAQLKSGILFGKGENEDDIFFNPCLIMGCF